MTSDPYRKVFPGERLAIPAAAWNRVIDQIALAPTASPSGGEASRIPNLRVFVRNDTSGTIDQWGILHITGICPAITGTTGSAFEQYQTSPAVAGVTPIGSTNGQFLVAVEPIKAGEFGLAAIDGVVQVKLDVTAESDRFATPKAGSTTEMKTASSGEATIIWKESGTGGGKWGLVRVGSGGGGVEGIRLGKITGTWSKAGTQTIYEHDGSGSPKSVLAGSSGATAPATFTGVNRFVTVTAAASAAKWVACGIVDQTWHLIAAECS
jgi:hypothetical protein